MRQSDKDFLESPDLRRQLNQLKREGGENMEEGGKEGGGGRKVMVALAKQSAPAKVCTLLSPTARTNRLPPTKRALSSHLNQNKLARLSNYTQDDISLSKCR